MFGVPRCGTCQYYSPDADGGMWCITGGPEVVMVNQRTTCALYWGAAQTQLKSPRKRTTEENPRLALRDTIAVTSVSNADNETDTDDPIDGKRFRNIEVKS